MFAQRAICSSLLMIGLIFINQAAAATVQLDALKDTMIFQNAVGNGAGRSPGFFVGSSNGPSPRRGMIAFDLLPGSSTIPSDAVITDVQLRLKIGQIAGGSSGFSHPTIGLHKLLVDWGEGGTAASTAPTLSGIGQGSAAHNGDATWNSSFHNSVAWTQPGGLGGTDYAASASASLVQSDVNGDISLWLSTPSLVADVQGWLTSPSTNFGWMLISENESSAQSFRGFYSRNFNPTPKVADLESYFPQLIVTYVPEPAADILLLGFATFVMGCRRRLCHGNR
jgi:hypothetical protein